MKYQEIITEANVLAWTRLLTDMAKTYLLKKADRMMHWRPLEIGQLPGSWLNTIPEFGETRTCKIVVLLGEAPYHTYSKFGDASDEELNHFEPITWRTVVTAAIPKGEKVYVRAANHTFHLDDTVEKNNFYWNIICDDEGECRVIFGCILGLVPDNADGEKIRQKLLARAEPLTQKIENYFNDRERSNRFAYRNTHQLMKKYM